MIMVMSMAKKSNALINMEDKTNAMVNVEKNSKCDINITINQLDELSYDNIRKNYEDVVALENEFSDRLEFGQDVLTKKLLPKQLQSDFEIAPRYSGNKVEFETKAITSDAYNKFPLRINYTMQFKDADEAKSFRENGLNKLIEEAEKTRKPVEITNITSMKEFIGEYEDPVGYANKHGCEGIKLYVCPSPLPPAQKYSIDIFNSDLSFNIETNLRLKNREKDNIILTNEESDDEPYNVMISLSDISKSDDGLNGRFNITVSLREKYKNRCEYCKEIIKYQFLIEDSDNHIQISNVDLNINIFTFNSCGSINHNNKDYKRINRLLSLIDKVIFISKVKNIDISFDIDYFFENEELINLLYNESIGKNYKGKKRMTFNSQLPLCKESEEFLSKKNNFNVTSELYYLDLFGTRIELKTNIITFNDCSIINVIKDDKKYDVKLEASNIKFNIKKNK